MKQYKDLNCKELCDKCEFDFGHFTYLRGQCSCCYGPKDLPDRYWREGKAGKEKAENGNYSFFLFKNAANGSGAVTKNDVITGHTYIEYCCRNAEQKELFCKLLSEQLGTDYIVFMPYSDKFCIVIREARSYARFDYNEKEAFLFCDGKVLDVYSVEQDNLTCVAAFWNTPDSLFIIREGTHSYVTVVRRETPRGYVADTDCIRFVLSEHKGENDEST